MFFQKEKEVLDLARRMTDSENKVDFRYSPFFQKKYPFAFSSSPGLIYSTIGEAKGQVK